MARQWKAVVLSARFRWLLAFGFALVCALAVNANRAAAAEVPDLDCSSVMLRQCTPSEELAFCFINSFLDYDECTARGGFANDVGCYIVYVGDFYGCFLDVGPIIFL